MVDRRTNMAKSAQEIVASIAPNEAAFMQNSEQFAGFVRKATSTRVDFQGIRI